MCKNNIFFHMIINICYQKMGILNHQMMEKIIATCQSGNNILWLNTCIKLMSNHCIISIDYQTNKMKHPEELTEDEAPPLQDTRVVEILQRSSASSHSHSPTKSPLDLVSNTNEQTAVSVVSTDSTITPSLVVPLYAVPEKVKTKVIFDQGY